MTNVNPGKLIGIAADLVHSGVVSSSLAVELRVRGSLFFIDFPVVCPGFPWRNRLSGNAGWSSFGVSLSHSTALVSVVDSVKVKGVRSTCFVLKSHLGYKKEQKKLQSIKNTQSVSRNSSFCIFREAECFQSVLFDFLTQNHSL